MILKGFNCVYGNRSPLALVAIALCHGVGISSESSSLVLCGVETMHFRAWRKRYIV
jgi:hypothetical protein